MDGGETLSVNILAVVNQHKISRKRMAHVQARNVGVLKSPAKNGEYDQLPIAVVAEELGVNMSAVRNLIWSGEVEPSDTSNESSKDRVSRAQLERAIEVRPVDITGFAKA